VNAVGSDQCSALLTAVACSRSSIHMVQLLIEHGADVNATRAVGETPLLIAVLEGRVDQAQALINAGADVNATFLIGFLGSNDVSSGSGEASNYHKAYNCENLTSQLSPLLGVTSIPLLMHAFHTSNGEAAAGCWH
jgi:hypothetical protein